MTSLATTFATTTAGNQATATRPALTVQSLGVRLGSFELQDFSLRLAPGTITALLGHNGAGKTTTLRLLAGVLRRDTGTIALGTIDSRQDEMRFKERVASVADEGAFYQTIKTGEFARFVGRFYSSWNTARCSELMQQLHLDPDKRIGELSRGSRLKLGLVLAFARDADVILLDEPTSTLDPRVRLEVVSLLRYAAAHEGRAILLATHNLLEAQDLVDQVVVVDRGRILFTGTAREFSGADAGADPKWSDGSTGRGVGFEEAYLGLVS